MNFRQALLTTVAVVAFASCAAAQSRIPIPDIKASMSGKTCGVGYMSSGTSSAPPDATPLDNPAAFGLTLKKSCAGAIIAEVTSETMGKIGLIAKATCTGTGGFANPCTVGQIKYSHYGTAEVFFDDHPDTAPESHAATFVFPGLKRGKWKIEILPGDAGQIGSTMGFRAMSVTAYSGG